MDTINGNLGYHNNPQFTLFWFIVLLICLVVAMGIYVWILMRHVHFLCHHNNNSNNNHDSGIENGVEMRSSVVEDPAQA